ncbi:hypothetical protein ABB37_04122 [Leptomonas pyrrhocoris]|uniref:Uncharacterized protein n=1 Tax=Leptomonas pyrrhocoris TaxID=157538 RepID=A0A0N0DWJ6_LEPPY|nr:hypothetical protein ABB37_04122 [Leptomonas pyrrhocoris]XP_015660310.1 hypothetical protein ABB37_04122 [Leptomonas pyrrhocoris]KPA81870.1 hypothetical protein ABB37_04122 [Leptomonas pyrrhocoris]KPA81871.1 hypothetical protein ABB37_04122 [Leptomonas pyrrhocoris]|eukprot:XP_015660309.1 hypothetical protein ABB37_04122 [Leptomonas pyrrhocoris]
MPPRRPTKNLSPEEVIAVRKVHVESLSQQCAAVEKMIAISTDQELRLDAEIAGLERRIAETGVATEQVGRDLDDKVKFMNAYATTNLEQLQQRHANMEKSVLEAEAENEALRAKLAELTQRKEAELAEWEAKVTEQQALMNAKALDFGLQLKETLAHNYSTTTA